MKKTATKSPRERKLAREILTLKGACVMARNLLKGLKYDSAVRLPYNGFEETLKTLEEIVDEQG